MAQIFLFHYDSKIFASTRQSCGRINQTKYALEDTDGPTSHEEKKEEMSFLFFLDCLLPLFHAQPLCVKPCARLQTLTFYSTSTLLSAEKKEQLGRKHRPSWAIQVETTLHFETASSLQTWKMLKPLLFYPHKHRLFHASCLTHSTHDQINDRKEKEPSTDCTSRKKKTLTHYIYFLAQHSEFHLAFTRNCEWNINLLHTRSWHQQIADVTSTSSKMKRDHLIADVIEVKQFTPCHHITCHTIRQPQTTAYPQTIEFQPSKNSV